ncbi:unnamed protein product [Orchesella dallaii]|uniref:Sialomucin core protein 24 n=1 Tax=Orchesella dallaii TaxID=48710 RepID=A0ABP1QUZ5_9HEXA
MPSTVPYSLALVVIVLTASIAVLGQGEKPVGQVDPCLAGATCQTCVVIKVNESSVTPSSGNVSTCVWEVTSSGQQCVQTYTPSQEISNVAFNELGCSTIPSSTTTTPPSTTNGTTTTTAIPTTTNATTTTTPPTTTNATTTVPTTLPTNATTTPATPTNGTTPITTPIPSNSSTTAAPPTPAPTKGGFSWASFIGGIVFAAALSSLAYLIWRFYKVRLDRNYHTFSNPTF